MKKALLMISIMALTTITVMAENIKIGVISSLSGPVAIYGQTTYNGVKLAVDKLNAAGGINGNKVELIVEDDKGDPAEAVTAAKRLISEKKVIAILGPTISSTCLAVAPIAQQNKVPMLTATGTNIKITDAGDYIARTCFIDPFQGAVMAKFGLENLKAKTAVIIKDVNSDYSEGLADEFVKVFEKNGGKILDTVAYATNDVDYSSQLTKVKSLNPDVIFVPGYYNEVSLLIKQARDLQIKSKFLGGDGWDNGKLFEIAGSAVLGSYISSHFSPESQDPLIQNFLSDYRKSFKEEPSVLSALGYDAAGIMLESVKNAKALTGEDIKNNINATKGYKGVTGVITLDEKRNAIKSAFVLEAKDGGFKYYATIEPFTVDETSAPAGEADSKAKKDNKGTMILIVIVAVLAAGIFVAKKKK